ncbi:MAG: type II secretion system protein GspG [Bdellovibrionales bacterium]|nr:type II secretion system protein GspG [Bdellovibrionales bacterium]
MKRLLKSSVGLSLIEMLVVIGILAFIVSVVARNVNQSRKKSDVNKAKILIGLIQQAMEEFSLDCGYYPESLEDLVSDSGECEEWGPTAYLKNGKIPKDPWGQNFVYQYNPEISNFEIISYGADRKPGGNNRFDKDISSSEI